MQTEIALSAWRSIVAMVEVGSAEELAARLVEEIIVLGVHTESDL